MSRRKSLPPDSEEILQVPKYIKANSLAFKIYPPANSGPLEALTYFPSAIKTAIATWADTTHDLIFHAIGRDNSGTCFNVYTKYESLDGTKAVSKSPLNGSFILNGQVYEIKSGPVAKNGHSHRFVESVSEVCYVNGYDIFYHGATKFLDYVQNHANIEQNRSLKKTCSELAECIKFEMRTELFQGLQEQFKKFVGATNIHIQNTFNDIGDRVIKFENLTNQSISSIKNDLFNLGQTVNKGNITQNAHHIDIQMLNRNIINVNQDKNEKYWEVKSLLASANKAIDDGFTRFDTKLEKTNEITEQIWYKTSNLENKVDIIDAQNQAAAQALAIINGNVIKIQDYLRDMQEIGNQNFKDSTDAQNLKNQQHEARMNMLTQTTDNLINQTQTSFQNLSRAEEGHLKTLYGGVQALHQRFLEATTEFSDILDYDIKVKMGYTLEKLDTLERIGNELLKGNRP